MTGLTSAAISSYTNNGNNRIVTSVNSSTVNSEANLTFDGTELNVNGNVTADSGSFNYITASIIDVNSDTIRLGGETFKKSDVVKLKQGKTLKSVGVGRAHGDLIAHDGQFDGTVSASKLLIDAPNPTDDFFLLKSGSLDSLKVNNQGVLVLGGFTFEPTAIKGGLYYNDDDDEFYAGKNN